MSPNKLLDIKNLLDRKYAEFNQPKFIEDDPIQIPHIFSKKEDIEIAGFLTATLAWGNRKAIVQSAQRWMNMMDYDPYNFIMHADNADYKAISKFYYRTFNGIDSVYFLKSLKRIYTKHQGLEGIFTTAVQQGMGISGGLIKLHELFFQGDFPHRTTKHLASVAKGSSCKRINLFLRWMVRKDNKGVDFGIWNNIPSSALYLPLDVHTGNVSRSLGLLTRKANDWKAVVELTDMLRNFAPEDPIKYDYALFGIGIEGL